MSYTLTQLLDLPAAEYMPAHKADIDCRQVVLADMHGLVVSDATSLRPCPGTHMLGDCVGILAVNPATRTASFGHAHGCEADAVRMTVEAARTSPEEPVELYFMGGNCNWNAPETAEKWHERMDSLVTGLTGLGNIAVKAFDVDKKPHPGAAALQWLEDGYRIVCFEPLLSSSDPDPKSTGVPGEALFREISGRFPTLTPDDPGYEDNQLARFMRQNQRLMHSPNLFDDLEDACVHIPTPDAPLTLQWDGRQQENQRRDLTPRPDSGPRSR
jgi:hypothetical protein